jgi:ribose/xylose/arabinose/galactoside ABC-type transport system permease subunit
MATPSPNTSAWKAFLFRHEMLLLLVLVVEWVFFYFGGTTTNFSGQTVGFGTAGAQIDILRHSCEIGLLALVMTPVILTGGIDLSVGSLMGLSAVVFGKLWRDAGVPIPAAIAATLALGALAGGLNATLITLLRLPPLIVTLGTFSLFRGLAEALTRGADTFTGFPAGFQSIGQDNWFGLPAQALIFAVVAISIWLLVHRTTLGRSFRTIGYSPDGARYAGLPVARRLTTVYVLAGMGASLAGLVFTARLNQAGANTGTGYELFAITAVVLGGTSIFGGSGSVHGTLLGWAAVAVLSDSLPYVDWPREVGGMLTGLLLILALSGGVLPKFLSRWRARRHAAHSLNPQTSPPHEASSPPFPR